MPPDASTNSPPPARRTVIATLLLLLGSSLLTSCQAAFFRGLNATANNADVMVQRDVLFDPVHQLKLDMYRPRDANHAPVGGAFLQRQLEIRQAAVVSLGR